LAVGGEVETMLGVDQGDTKEGFVVEHRGNYTL
jgi:hypothetical protein